MRQSKFYNIIDLDLYTSLLKLVDQKDSFGIAVTEYQTGITYSDFCKCLENFATFSVTEKRAIALAITGTEFETEEMADCILEMATNSNDVIARIAYLKSSYKIREFEEGVKRLLLNAEYKYAEEVTLAVLSIDPQNAFGCDDLLIQLIEGLKGNVEFIELNKDCFNRLLDWNNQSTMKVGLLSFLETVISDVPGIGSNYVGELLWNGFRYVDVLHIIITMREYDSKYSRGFRKTEKAAEQLKTELAQSFRAWSVSEKELVKKYGNLGSRIYATSNYVWYHDNVGFSMPELQLNLKDKRALFKKVNCLSDLEKCVLAMCSDLGRDQAKFLNIKFSEWNVEIQSLFDKYNEDGTIEPVDKRFLARSKGITDLGNNQEDNTILAAKILLDDINLEEYSYELAERVLPFSKDAYIAVVLEISDDVELTEEQIVEFEKIYYDSEDDNDIDFVAELEKNGWTSNPESSLGTRTLWMLLNKTCEDKQKVYEVLRNTKIYPTYIQKFVDTGRVLTSMKSYERFLREENEDTKNAYALADARQFRQFADLTLKQCYSRLNTAAKLLNAFLVRQYDHRDIYENVMPEILRDWIITGSPIHKLREKVSISSALNLTKEQEDEWFSKIKKKEEEARSLSEMSTTLGYIDDERCILTSIGIINLDGVKTGDVTLPVWVLDNSGEQYSLMVTGLAFGEPMRELGLPDIYCDTVIQLKLRRVD